MSSNNNYVIFNWEIMLDAAADLCVSVSPLYHTIIRESKAINDR